MKAEDLIKWLEKNTEYDSQYSFYLKYIEELKINNNSNIISIRLFLQDKPEILLNYIDQNGINEIPNFIYKLINTYFKNNLYSTTNYLLNFANDEKKLKALENEIFKFFKSAYNNKLFELISNLYYYPNLKNIIEKKYKKEMQYSLNQHIINNPDFKKELELFHFKTNIYNF